MLGRDIIVVDAILYKVTEFSELITPQLPNLSKKESRPFAHQCPLPLMCSE